MPQPRLAPRLAALTLLLAAGSAVATALPSQAAASAPAAADDEQGALIGDLVFHADLLSALDRLCPPRHTRGAVTDWHGALRPLLDEAFTPELRALSQRLGADAGAQLVQQRGGCHTSGYAAAYNESKHEYRLLFDRWKALDSD